MHAKLLQSCLTLCDPMDVSLPGSLCPWDFPGKNTRAGIALLRWGLPNPRIEPESLNSPALAGEFFATSTTWEALTFMYSISLLIFCQVVLSVIENEGLKTPTATVELSISSFSSVGFPSCILGLYYHIPEGLQLVCLQWIDAFIIINWHAC